MSVRPAKTQISLGIRPVWSESWLCTQWVAKDPSFLHADSEDSDQTGRMPRLIWVFAGRTVTLLVLSCRGSYWFVLMRNNFTILSLAHVHFLKKIGGKTVHRCNSLSCPPGQLAPPGVKIPRGILPPALGIFAPGGQDKHKTGWGARYPGQGIFTPGGQDTPAGVSCPPSRTF